MTAPTLEQYATKYRHARFRREDGILEVTLHSGDKNLFWGFARRYARDVMTHEYKRLMHDLLGYGLALEGMRAVEHWPSKLD